MVNKAILVGHLCADADVRQTPTGQVVANFRVATNERWTDRQSGETVERAEFHRLALWGKPAESLGKYLRKGRLVYVEGPIRTTQYEDKDGVTRFSTQILVRLIQLLGKATDASESTATENGAQDVEFPPVDTEAGVDEPVPSS